MSKGNLFIPTRFGSRSPRAPSQGCTLSKSVRSSAKPGPELITKIIPQPRAPRLVPNRCSLGLARGPENVNGGHPLTQPFIYATQGVLSADGPRSAGFQFREALRELRFPRLNRVLV